MSEFGRWDIQWNMPGLIPDGYVEIVFTGQDGHETVTHLRTDDFLSFASDVQEAKSAIFDVALMTADDDPS